MDSTEWFEKVLLPVGSGILGAAGTLWRLTQSLVDDIKDLKRRVEVLEKEKATIEAQVKTLETKSQDKDHRISVLEREQQRQNETVSSFAEEQRGQWHELYRTLGQIEGELGATRPSHSPPRRGLKIPKRAWL